MTDRILLIGATGFLGSHVAARLANRNPLVLVRPSSDRSVLSPDLEVRVGDLAESVPLDGVTSLVYCASMGFGHVPPLVARLADSHVRKAVFVSTTAIFTSLTAPSRAIRLAAEAAVQTSRLQWTILRPTLIYGTARDRNISRLLRFLRRWPVFPVCGGGLWQPVYVDDVADAVVAALDRPRAACHAYNLAGAAPLSFANLVCTAARAIGRRVVLLRVPLRAAVLAARVTRVVSPEQVRRLAEHKAFDYAEAARDLGFRPRSFAEGVALEARSLGYAVDAPR